MTDKPKKSKPAKFEMNPEVSITDTKAAAIKMEATGDEEISRIRQSIRAKKMNNSGKMSQSKEKATGIGEEVDQIDELRASTLYKYSIKAAQQGNKRLAGQKMADEKIRKKHGYSSDAKVAAESVDQIDEVLSVVGRLAAARRMAKSGNSGILQRGKRKKSFMAMTMKRASGLGWKAARRQIKQKLSKGQALDTMSAQSKTRIELIANKRKNIQKVIARKLTRGYLNKEDVNVNKAFNLMLEGKRYNQLMTKEGKVNLSFKLFKEKINPFYQTKTNEELVDAIVDMYNIVSNVPKSQLKEAAALKALTMFIENDSSVSFHLQVQKVARSFGVDSKQLKEMYRELDA